MNLDQIIEYEVFSMSFIESWWARIFPNYIGRKVARKIKRYNESIELYNKLNQP